jgi:anthranilate synthase component 2
MQILIIDNYDSFTYNLYHYFVETGHRVRVYRNDRVPKTAIHDASHLVFSPGPGLPEDAGDMMDILQQNLTKKSILGVCLGMQGLALAFGGSLYNMETVMHGRQVEVQAAGKTRFFKDIQSPFQVGLYHSWAVDAHSLPPEIIPTAFSQQGILMGIEHKTLPISGVQFHPESIMTPLGKQMLHQWVG